MLLIPSKNVSDIPNLLGEVRAERPTYGARDHQFPTRLLDLALVFDDVYGNVQYTKRHAQKKDGAGGSIENRQPSLARSACCANTFMISAPVNGALASGAGRSVMAKDG